MTSTMGGGVEMRPTPAADASSARLRLVYVPILDVARGVTAGYQTRAVSDTVGESSGLSVPPLELDLDGTLTARAARLALDSVPTLPTNTFLSLPVGAQIAAAPAVRDVLGAHGSLAGIVLDLTGFVGGNAIGELDRALAEYRSAGALLAIGGHGAAQPELSSIIRFQPAILRLGRDWVRGVDRSESKRSAIEVIGQLASQLDAWVLAEGIESAAELRALAGLGVPLAQGTFIGSADTRWSAVEPVATHALPRETPAVEGVLSPYLQPAYTARDAAAAAAVLPETSGFDLVVILDAHERPTSVLERSPNGSWVSSPMMAVGIDTPVASVVARAMTRPRATRFSPLACTDEQGVFLGVLSLERLMHRLTA